MGFLSNLRNDFGYVRKIKSILKLVKDVDSESSHLVPDDLECSVDKFANNLAFMAEGQKWTYREFDNYANQIAHWALAQGCTKGDTVAVFVRNRLEYVALWFGLAKIGVIPALINYQLRAKALAHCINISSAKLAIIDCELSKDWNSAAEFLEGDVKAFGAFGKCKGLADFDNDVASHSADRPARSHREGIKGKDTFMKMFTSGTTGLPKAAKVAHTRGQYYLRGFCIPAKATSKDRLMMVLPLYHATGGLCGVGIALTKGGAVIVNSKFSVSGFWDEVAQTEATIFMYVGELCRFLLNADAHPKERAHKLRCIVGNGLSKDVWEEFITRFDIADVVEFYGATEGNISLMNFDGPPGAVGRIPEFLRAKMNGDLIRYDVETGTHIKGADGLYMRTEVGEIGELVGEIRKGETRFRYDGYEDKEASDKKILHNVLKKDDMWFRTGDLLWRDERGYYFFADRIGDTYRWKAENVSTGEVAAAMSAFDGVHQANVYGVEIPGYDGRAGMASLVADKNLDLEKLHTHICDALPAYAQPVFLRISDETETTSTFKFKKTNLVKDGFDPARVKDMLFVNHPEKKSYEKLGKVLYKKIQNCELKF